MNRQIDPFPYLYATRHYNTWMKEQEIINNAAWDKLQELLQYGLDHRIRSRRMLAKWRDECYAIMDSIKQQPKQAPMKKYRLKQDYRTPGIIVPSGTVGEVNRADIVSFGVGYNCMNYHINVVQNTPDWFEEIKENTNEIALKKWLSDHGARRVGSYVFDGKGVITRIVTNHESNDYHIEIYPHDMSENLGAGCGSLVRITF